MARACIDRDAFVQVGSEAVKAMIEESLLGILVEFRGGIRIASLAEEKFPDLFWKTFRGCRAAAAQRVVRVLLKTPSIPTWRVH